MDTINTGSQGGPRQASGTSTQTAQQGVSNARGTDTAQSAVNSGLHGVLATVNYVRTALDKQLTIANSTYKLSVQWNGSLKTMSESATQTNKALAASTDAVKNETTARKENTKSSSQENQARQAAKVILDREAIQRKKQLESDVLKNRLDIIQHASLGAAIKHSRDVMAERAKVEQQIQKNEQDMLAARSKQDVKKLNDERNLLQKQLADNTKLTDAAQSALKTHTGGIASASDAMVKFKKKLQDFATGAMIGQAVRKTYEEAQSAKTTGNYANMGQFEQGQSDALFTVGVGSQVYNDIVANARAAQLTTSSFKEFNAHLVSGTDKMQTLTGSREEGAKLAGEMYQTAGLVGITMADMGSQMDVLGDTFGRLTKLTGKTSAEMAQLSMSIMTDTDHRSVMLGMQSSERSEYVQKRMQDLEALKLQGFSIEQAQELQKMAMRARTQGLAEHVGKDAKASSQVYVMANMLGGKAGAQMLGAQQRIAALDQEASSTKITEERAGEIEQEKARLRTEINKAYADGRKTKLMGTAERYTLNTAHREFVENTDISEKNSAYETGSTEAQKRAKRDEGNIGGKGTALDIATTAAGYTTALTKNTAALDLLTIVMGAKSVVDGLSLLKGTPIAGKLMSTVTTVATAGKTAISGAAPVAMSTAETIARSKGFLAGTPTAGNAITAGKGLLTAGSLVKGAAGGLGGLAGYGFGVMGEKAGGYGTNAGTALNLASNVAEGASTGAMLGALLGPPGAMIGGIAGGTIGAGATAYNYYNSPSAKLARQEQEAKEKVEKESAEQQKKQTEMAKDGGIRTSSTENLQREFFMLAIEFYRNADPLADKASRDRHAQALHRLATNSNLDNAAFSGTPTSTGG